MPDPNPSDLVAAGVSQSAQHRRDARVDCLRETLTSERSVTVNPLWDSAEDCACLEIKFV